MMIVLDTCNWGIEGVDELPPHYHYVAGLVEMPDGRKEWIGGAVGAMDGLCEQKEFISMDLRIDRNDLIALIEKLRGIPPRLLPPEQDQMLETQGPLG